LKIIRIYLIPLITIGSLISLISNIAVFRSYIIQQKSVSDMNNVVPKMSLDEALENDLLYPNINIFTVPFKTSLGRVYLRDSLYEKAIKSFHLARKNNPFLLINENYLAETYLKINQIDSFSYYAKKIFYNAPNHPSHFNYFLKSIGEQSNSKLIDSAFNLISFKSEHVWKIYLSKLYHTDDKLDNANLNIKIADSLFPKNREIQYFIAAIKFGQENLKKAIELISVADKIAKLNDFEGSVNVLKDALKLYPDNNEILDKIATSYFKLKKYESSLEFINRIDLRKNNDEGRYRLIKGINLVKLNKKTEGCNEIYQSILLGNNEAIKANRSFCN